MISKQEYERRINESELFNIKRVDNTDLFDTLKRKLLDDLANYYNCYVNSKTLEKYSLEIVETATSCINSYDKSHGLSFLLYFFSMFKIAQKKANAHNAMDEVNGGIHISHKDQLLISQIVNLFNYKMSTGEFCDIADECFINIASFKLNLPYEKVKELIQINEKTKIVSEFVPDDEGKEISIFETEGIADKNLLNLETVESINEIFNTINVAFSELQERTKPLIKELITALILKSDAENYDAMRNYQCFDCCLIDGYESTGKVPAAKEIARKYGVHEASASRTLNNFLAKIKEIEILKIKL